MSKIILLEVVLNMGKEVNLRNGELMNIANSLGEFMQLEMPIKVGWNLKKNMTKIQSAVKAYAEFEQELLKKYGVVIDGKFQFKENGQPKIYPANEEKFNNEHDELLNCESQLDFLTIKLSDLEGKNIKPSLLFNLEFMIEDDLEENKPTT